MSTQPRLDPEVRCGFLKMKFDLNGDRDLHECPGYQYATEFSNCRVTLHHAYVSLGHDDIRDNDHARELIRTCRKVRGKVTRVDFYVDYVGLLNFDAYYALVNTGIPPTPSILKSPQGTTVYVGKRQSPLMLRVYDKRKEIIKRQKVDVGFDITRIELECKRIQVPKMLALFMAGQERAILDIIQERYQLRGWCASHLRYKDTLPKAKKSDPMAIVYRYRKAIRDAYLQSPMEFMDVIGVYNGETS